jgi:hypothetical protein
MIGAEMPSFILKRTQGGISKEGFSGLGVKFQECDRGAGSAMREAGQIPVTLDPG